MKAAQSGKTWLLLPEGFRDMDCGQTYPLPSRRTELHLIGNIYFPNLAKDDSGCQYIRRAQRRLRELSKNRQSAILDVDFRHEKIRLGHNRYNKEVEKRRTEMKEAVNTVKKEASEAIANLNDLFSLGRKGIDGQMKAHLQQKEWKGEAISARDFRDCFRMVITGVKGLGLPSEQRKHAGKAVIEELASSLDDIENALKLAPGPDDETEH